MAAFEALYAGAPPPGGFVIPCLEPVITTDLGVLVNRSNERMASMPFSGPKTLVSNVCFNQFSPTASKYNTIVQTFFQDSTSAHGFSFPSYWLCALCGLAAFKNTRSTPLNADFMEFATSDHLFLSPTSISYDSVLSEGSVAASSSFAL